AAALGTSSSVPMFHVIGVTPEAPDLASAFGGRAPRRTLRVGRERLRDAWRELDDPQGPPRRAAAEGAGQVRGFRGDADDVE
ncbi:aconitase X, partial [Pseudomonas aeruginosa]